MRFFKFVKKQYEFNGLIEGEPDWFFVFLIFS